MFARGRSLPHVDGTGATSSMSMKSIGVMVPEAIAISGVRMAVSMATVQTEQSKVSSACVLGG